MRRERDLVVPSRHLGLVQAGEIARLDSFIDRCAAIVSAQVDLDAVASLALPLQACAASGLPPPGQHVAVASDEAFSFAYPHLLDDWRHAGAELSFFSPLADETPADHADAVFLPGGYPELHAGRLADASRFRQALHAHARDGLIYGECGGFMALGEGLVDGRGERHAMLGLLPLETSFAERRRQLGYRTLQPRAALPWNARLHGHEFHYCTTVRSGGCEPLFDAFDAEGQALPPMGLRVGRIMGSFAHVIDKGEGAHA